MDSTTSPKVKTSEGKGEGVGVCSLAHNISGVKGMLELQDVTRMNDKWFNYSHGLTQTKQQLG
jgi:hypothetical protein